jgi:hypothetical protein
MSRRDDEVERLRRIRDRQLQLRDPMANRREVQHRVSSRYQPEKLTLAGVVREIPGKWLGTLLGGLIGILLGVLFDLVVAIDAWWVAYVPYVIAFAGFAVGRMLGAVLDWREEDHDALVQHR